MTTTETGPRTISRSCTRQIAALRETMTRCYSHSLAGNFIAQPCDPARAWAALEASRNARLRDNGDGSCTVRIHSSLWYDLRPGRAPTDLAARLASFRHYPPEPNTSDSPCWLCTFPVRPHQGLIALGSDNGRTFAATLHRGCLAEVDAARPGSLADAGSADEAAERRDSEMFGAPDAEVTGTPEFERRLAEANAVVPPDPALAAGWSTAREDGEHGNR
jgi:hypothetical protein